MSKLTPNAAIASLWFALSLTIVLVALFSGVYNQKFSIVPSLFGLAVIFVFMGRQRTARWQSEETKFNTIMRYTGLSVALLASLSIPFSGIN